MENQLFTIYYNPSVVWLMGDAFLESKIPFSVILKMSLFSILLIWFVWSNRNNQ